jgi:lipopolysaccharide export LptBFGC system permease protein LptF
VGAAESVQLGAARSGLAVTLGPGEAHATSGAWALTYAGLTTTLPVGGPDGEAGSRLAFAERSSVDLWERVRAGRLNPYERWIWWKRTAVPCIMLFVAALGLPLGARVGPGVGAGVLGALFWALLRASDAVAQSQGAGWALATLGVPTALAAALAWATWRDR